MFLFENKIKKTYTPCLVSVVHLACFLLFHNIYFFLGGGGGFEVFVASQLCTDEFEQHYSDSVFVFLW